MILYEYDLEGNRIREKREQEAVKGEEYPEKREEKGRTQYIYDKMDRRIKVIGKEGGAGTRYWYDEFGRITKIENGLGYVEEKNSYSVTGRLYKREAGEGLLAEYQYDIGGRIRKVITEEGKEKEKIYYKYNEEGELIESIAKGARYRYEYDREGRILRKNERRKEGEKVLVRYEYEKNSNIKEILFANGIKTCYSYDRERNITKLITIGKEGKELLSYEYEYDGNGNEIKKERGENKGRISYKYDSLQRIKEVEYGKGEEERFEYDKAGNRVYRRYGEEEYYKYNKKNELLEIERRKKGEWEGRREYRYDRQGNTIEEKIEEGEGRKKERIRYDYNVFGQRKRIEREKEGEEGKRKEIQENRYDGEGIRNAIVENGKETEFLTDGYYIIGESKKEERKRIIRGYGIVAEEKEGRYGYYHENEHGDIEAISGEEGEVRNGYEYDVYGGIREEEEKEENRYRYGGEVYDKISEEYYLRERNYKAEIGRFREEDIYRGDGLSLYVYCGNNPVRYIDPSGYVYVYINNLFGLSGYSGNSSSSNLGKNMFEHLGMDPNTKGVGSHEKQHLIPQEIANNSNFLRSIGFNVDHHQNGIFDKNMNKNTTLLIDKVRAENISSGMQARYISDNTHHGGYHSLYSEEVKQRVENIEIKMAYYENSLRNQNKYNNEIDQMVNKESRKQVHSLLEELRVMNQNGINIQLFSLVCYNSDTQKLSNWNLRRKI